MKIARGWCGKHLGEKFPEQPGVSHGICESCAKRVKEERVEERESIEWIDEECEHCRGQGYWETTVNEQGAYGPTGKDITYRNRCPVCGGRGILRVQKFETIGERRERISKTKKGY